MTGEIKKFKRSVFGGFDCNEVVEYIGRLSAQRNDYKAAGEKMGAELEEAKSELEDLRIELASVYGEMEELTRAAAQELCKNEEQISAVSKERDDAVRALDEVRLKAADNTKIAVQNVRDEIENERKRAEEELEKKHREETDALIRQYEQRLNECRLDCENRINEEKQRINELKTARLNTACGSVKELEAVYGGVQTNLENASAVLSRELDRVKGEIAVIVSALDKTGKCVDEFCRAAKEDLSETELSDIEPEGI